MANKEKKGFKQYFNSFQKYILIPFEDYFGKDADIYDEFTLSVAAKKTYAKIIPFIVSSNNILLNLDDKIAEEFIYKYYTLKRGLDNRRYTENQSFINDMIASIFTPKMIELIIKYVDDNYQMNIDEAINEKQHKYDPGTTFYDRHFKILHCVSVMSKLIIPLSTHYIYCNPSKDANKFLIDVFMALFNVIESETGTDIYNKLQVYVTRQVNKTLYNDRVMWERLKILAVTPDSTIEDTLNKIVTNVIPKYVFDQNLMNFNTVVIDRSVRKYTLKKEDSFTIYALNNSETMSSDDNSIATEAEIFDSYNVKRDESVIFFRNHGIKQVITRISLREGVTVNPDELAYYLKTFEYHEFQKFVVIQAFSRYFGGGENILACKKEDYVLLMIILTKIMHNFGIDSLIKYVTGKKHSYAYRRMSKSLDNSINENPMYIELVENKYRFVKNVVLKKNIIKNTIMTLINNVYVFNEYKGEQNGQFIPKVEQDIVTGVLAFYNKLIL